MALLYEGTVSEHREEYRPETLEKLSCVFQNETV
jgi:hypothetical protein